LVSFRYEQAYADRIYPGVSALGLDLGGATREEAVTKLRPALARRATEPVLLIAGTQRWQVTAHDVGLRLDAESLADDAFRVGREGPFPIRLWHPLTLRLATYSLDGPIAAFDEAVARAFFQHLAAEIDRPVIE